MKKTILLLGAILLLSNIIIGIILSCIETFNVVACSIVIIQTVAILYLTNVIVLKDGYKVSFLFLFTIIGTLCYFMSLFAPAKLENNWWLIAVVIFIVFEAVLLVIANKLSKTIK